MQQRRSQLLTHFLGAEVGVRPLVCVVAQREFGERTGAKDGGITGAKGVVYDQPVVKDQEGAADALEGIVINSSVGDVNQHLRQQKQRQLIILTAQKVILSPTGSTFDLRRMADAEARRWW